MVGIQKLNKKELVRNLSSLTVEKVQKNNVSDLLNKKIKEELGLNAKDFIKKYNLSKIKGEELEGTILIILSLHKKGWKDKEIKEAIPYFTTKSKLYIGSNITYSPSYAHLVGITFFGKKKNLSGKDLNLIVNDTTNILGNIFGEYNKFINVYKNRKSSSEFLNYGYKLNAFLLSLNVETVNDVIKQAGGYKVNYKGGLEDRYNAYINIIKNKMDQFYNEYNGKDPKFKKYFLDSVKKPLFQYSLMRSITFSLISNHLDPLGMKEERLNKKLNETMANHLISLAIQYKGISEKDLKNNPIILEYNLLSGKLDKFAGDREYMQMFASKFADLLLKYDKKDKNIYKKIGVIRDEILKTYCEKLGINYDKKYNQLYLVIDADTLKKANMDKLYATYKEFLSYYNLTQVDMEAILHGDFKSINSENFKHSLIYSKLKRAGYSVDDTKHILSSLFVSLFYALNKIKTKSATFIKMGVVETKALDKLNIKDYNETYAFAKTSIFGNKKLNDIEKKIVKEAVLNNTIQNLLRGLNARWGSTEYLLGGKIADSFLLKYKNSKIFNEAANYVGLDSNALRKGIIKEIKGISFDKNVVKKALNVSDWNDDYILQYKILSLRYYFRAKEASISDTTIKKNIKNGNIFSVKQKRLNEEQERILGYIKDVNKLILLLPKQLRTEEVRYGLAGFLEQGASIERIKDIINNKKYEIDTLSNPIPKPSLFLYMVKNELEKPIVKEVKYKEKPVSFVMKNGTFDNKNIKYASDFFFGQGLEQAIVNFYTKKYKTKSIDFKEVMKQHAGNVAWYKRMASEYYSKLSKKFKDWNSIKTYANKNDTFFNHIVNGIEKLSKKRKINKREAFLSLLTIVHCEYSWRTGKVDRTILRNRGVGFETYYKRLKGITLEDILKLKKDGITIPKQDVLNILKRYNVKSLWYVGPERKPKAFNGNKDLKGALEGVLYIKDNKGIIYHLSLLTLWARIKSNGYLNNIAKYKFSKNGSINADLTLLNFTRTSGWDGNLSYTFTPTAIIKAKKKSKEYSIVTPFNEKTLLFSRDDLQVIRHEKGLPYAYIGGKLKGLIGYSGTKEMEMFLPVMWYKEMAKITPKYEINASITNDQCQGDNPMNVSNIIFNTNYTSSEAAISYINNIINNAVQNNQTIHDAIINSNGNTTFYLYGNNSSLTQPSGVNYLKVVVKGSKMELWVHRKGREDVLLGVGDIDIRKSKVDLSKISKYKTAPVFLDITNLAYGNLGNGINWNFGLRGEQVYLYKRGPIRPVSGMHFSPLFTLSKSFKIGSGFTTGALTFTWVNKKMVLLPSLSWTMNLSKRNHSFIALSASYVNGKVGPGVYYGTNFNKIRLGVGGGPGYFMAGVGYDGNKDGVTDFGVNLIFSGPVTIPDVVINGKGILSSVLSPITKFLFGWMGRKKKNKKLDVTYEKVGHLNV